MTEYKKADTVAGSMLEKLREADLEVVKVEAELERLRKEINIAEKQKMELMRKGFLYAEVVRAEDPSMSLEVPERFWVMFLAKDEQSQTPHGFEDYFADRRISHEDVVAWCSEILADGRPKRLREIMAELSADELGKGWRVPGKQAPSNVSWHLGHATEVFESPKRGWWQLRNVTKVL